MMANGEDLAAWSQRIAVPLMRFWEWDGWQVHCGLSALEHLFRLGAKDGEEVTDWQAFVYWSRSCDSLRGWVQLRDEIMFERKKVGR